MTRHTLTHLAGLSEAVMLVGTMPALAQDCAHGHGVLELALDQACQR